MELKRRIINLLKIYDTPFLFLKFYYRIYTKIFKG